MWCGLRQHLRRECSYYASLTLRRRDRLLFFIAVTRPYKCNIWCWSWILEQYISSQNEIYSPVQFTSPIHDAFFGLIRLRLDL